MKRWLRTYALALALLLPQLKVAGQDAAASAAAQAERQETEERYKRLTASIEDLLAAQAATQKRLAALGEELQGMRDERARTAHTYVTRDELKKVVEKIQELDRKREEDKRLILEEIRKLATAPAPEPPPKKAPPPTPPAAAAPKGYEYQVKEGDFLDAIIAAYREKGVKVTRDQVLKANPNLKPNRLRVGQKVLIPDPNAP